MRLNEQRKQLVKRRPTVLNAESARVITRPHIPGDEARTKVLIDRVSKLRDEDVQHLLDAVMQDFSGRPSNNFYLAPTLPQSIQLRQPRSLIPLSFPILTRKAWPRVHSDSL
jgi:hypothetical protein